MSISSEITRISNAKTAISESIANKGVTVPSGTKIDGMATLIDSIQTGGAAVQPSKALTVTSNGTTTITPDAPYDALSSVDVTVNVSGGYNLKKVTYKESAHKRLEDITITHNCGSIPKFVIVMSNNSNASYLMAGSGANESQNTSFSMAINNIQATTSVTSTTFTYRDAGSIRYYRGITYTYYFFY